MTNISKLIADAVAAGKVRRFERGESSQFDGIQFFLRQRGITVYQHKNRFVMKREGQKGRPAIMVWSKVVEEVDRIRVSEGLLPIRADHRKTPSKIKKVAA